MYSLVMTNQEYLISAIGLNPQTYIPETDGHEGTTCHLERQDEAAPADPGNNGSSAKRSHEEIIEAASSPSWEVPPFKVKRPTSCTTRKDPLLKGKIIVLQ